MRQCLLTKTFDKVQDQESPLGGIYFPWLKAVTADYREDGDRIEEFEVSRRKAQRYFRRRIPKCVSRSGWGRLF